MKFEQTTDFNLLKDALVSVKEKASKEALELIKKDLEKAGFKDVKIGLAPGNEYSQLSQAIDDFAIILIKAVYKTTKVDVRLSHQGYTFYVDKYHVPGSAGGRTLAKKLDRVI